MVIVASGLLEVPRRTLTEPRVNLRTGVVCVCPRESLRRPLGADRRNRTDCSCLTPLPLCELCCALVKYMREGQ